jgi:glycosyltransferase involved in cell wall biosynthesis
MKEIIQGSINGVILNTAQDVLAALNFDPEQKKRLTEKAYQDFLEKFTIEKMLSMTEKAYESIIRS